MNPSRLFSLEEAVYLCQGLHVKQSELRFVANAHFTAYEHYFRSHTDRISDPSFAREAREYAREQALIAYRSVRK